jgi:ribonuclease BN (tRNA processing enzyme)
MKVTILGSGTCVPRLARSASAVLVEDGATRILLDLGPGTLRRLLEYGLTIFDIDHILLSHFHPDHTAELVSFLFATKYPDGTRRRRQLRVAAGEGFKKFYKALQAAYGEWIVLPGEQLAILELDTRTGETLHLGDTKVLARPVNHRPESLAFRFEDRAGRSMVYSGDTDESDSLVALARDADLFICEAALPDEHKVPGHLTPSRAGRMAARARAKRLVLTHLYPECDGVDLAGQAATTYDGSVVVAEDLMSFRLD